MKKYVYLIFTILFLSYLSGCKLDPTETYNPIQRKIDNALSEQTHLYNFNGIISVNKNGKEIFNKSYYESPYFDNNNDLKFTNDTKFMIGSISKQFIAMCVLILQEQGKLLLFDTVNMYIPDFPKGEQITIHDLLTHSSGLHRDPFCNYMIQQFDADFFKTNVANIITDQNNFDFIRSEYSEDINNHSLILKKSTKNRKKSELLSILFQTCYITQNLFDNSSQLINQLIEKKQISFISKPTEQFSYSNFGYMILGVIIEKISGLSLAEFMYNNIFESLQMTNTAFNYEVTDDFAPALSDYKEVITQNIKMDVWPGAAGGLHSTINDLKKWIAFLSDDTIVPSEKKALIWGAYQKSGNSFYGYGTFQSERKINKKTVLDIHHNGYIMSYNSSIHILPTKKIYIIILSNDIQVIYGQEKWIKDILSKLL